MVLVLLLSQDVLLAALTWGDAFAPLGWLSLGQGSVRYRLVYACPYALCNSVLAYASRSRSHFFGRVDSPACGSVAFCLLSFRRPGSRCALRAFREMSFVYSRGTLRVTVFAIVKHVNNLPYFWK